MHSLDRRNVAGIHVIRARGTADERARAHMTLMRHEARTGALQHLSEKNEWMIRKAPGPLQWKPLQAAVLAFYRKLLIPYMDRHTVPEYRRLIEVISDSLGVSRDWVRSSLFQPDAFMLLCRISVMKYLLPQMPSGGLPGCTSATVLKGWTREGKLMVARNQDYPVVGPWEPNTTVMFSEPTEVDQIPHVSITTAGVHGLGLTAMNREGITVSSHAHFGRKVSLRGQPVIVVGSEIIRHAKSVGEAVDIARRIPTIANWAFMVASARENDAVVIEKTPSKTCVRQAEDGFLSHTNYFHSPELQGQEARISAAYTEDLVGRICRIREILEKDRGSLEPHHLSRALGDPRDYFSGEDRVVGNTVSVITTIKSAVFEPETQRFWVSARRESPMGLGDFVEFRADRFWEEDWSEEKAQMMPRISGFKDTKPGFLESVAEYRKAYQAWHMSHGDPLSDQNTLVHLKKAVAHFPSDGHLWTQMGLVSFRLKEFSEARRAFEEALSRKLSPAIRGVCQLFLARCWDLAGDRVRALECYAKYPEGMDDPRLAEAFRRGREKPFRLTGVDQIMVDLQFPDTLAY